jgi:hypothetical protein
VVVSKPGAVVVAVVDPVGAVVGVVVVLACANPADTGSAVRTEQTAIAAAAERNLERVTRAQGEESQRPNCIRLKFIPAPEYA